MLCKGDKGRSTILAEPVIVDLQSHIERVKALHLRDLEEGFRERKHHVMESGLQKAVKRAAYRAGIDNGINIRVLQELMGHTDVKTTERYTHVMDINFLRKEIFKIIFFHFLKYFLPIKTLLINSHSHMELTCGVIIEGKSYRVRKVKE